MRSEDHTLALKEWVLDRARLYARLPIDSGFWRSMSLSVDDLGRLAWDMAIRAEFEVLQDKLPPVSVTDEKSVEVETWTSAWQLFKYNHWNSRWFSWTLRPFCEPAKSEVVTKHAHLKVDLQRWITYPEAQYIPPRDGYDNKVRGYALTKESWWGN